MDETIGMCGNLHDEIFLKHTFFNQNASALNI